MKSGDIITYRAMCDAENISTLQRGMNFRLNPTHSVLLMSTQSNAPYDDEIMEDGTILIYEGHDVSKTSNTPNPKIYNQPMHTQNGKLTPNGLFYKAAKDFQADKAPCELVKVYEKLKPGIWVYNGQFGLIDAWQETSGVRTVFKFKLEMLENDASNDLTKSTDRIVEHARFIPSKVKIEVWQRDKGVCVKCGNTTNLHYDHIIPYSRGGTSLSAENIQLLCMSCNLTKSNRIE